MALHDPRPADRSRRGECHRWDEPRLRRLGMSTVHTSASIYPFVGVSVSSSSCLCLSRSRSLSLCLSISLSLSLSLCAWIRLVDRHRLSLFRFIRLAMCQYVLLSVPVLASCVFRVVIVYPLHMTIVFPCFLVLVSAYMSVHHIATDLSICSST